MPSRMFDDDTIELVCPRCAQTTPKTVEWLRVNDRYICPACSFEVILDRDKQVPGLDRPEA